MYDSVSSPYVEDLKTLARSYEYGLHNYEKSGPLFREILKIEESATSPQSPETLSALHDVALNYERLKQYDKAESLCKRLVDTQTKAYGPDSQQLIFSLNLQREIFMDEGRYPAAEAASREQLRISNKNNGPGSAMSASVMEGLVEVLRHEGKITEAKQFESNAQAIRAKTNTHQEHPVRAQILNK